MQTLISDALTAFAGGIVWVSKFRNNGYTIGTSRGGENMQRAVTALLAADDSTKQEATTTSLQLITCPQPLSGLTATVEVGALDTI